MPPWGRRAWEWQGWLRYRLRYRLRRSLTWTGGASLRLGRPSRITLQLQTNNHHRPTTVPETPSLQTLAVHPLLGHATASAFENVYQVGPCISWGRCK